MNIFNLIFKRNKTNSNEQVKKVQGAETDKENTNSSKDHQSINARDIKDSIIIQYFEESSYTGPLVDQKINEDVELIRKSRFINEFDTVHSSLALLRKLVKGDISSGSDEVRSRAIAWCARLISLMELDKAQEYLNTAKTLGSCPEIEIAEAFICSQKGDKNTALSILAGINSTLSHTAALMIVARHDGAHLAIDWLKTVGSSIADLDSDGKWFLLTLHLRSEQWESAQQCLSEITGDDLRETPALHHIVGITHLISAVPCELRTIVVNQVPFQGADFPLAADTSAIEARQVSHSYFITAAEVARKLHCPSSAKVSDEYALWLELKDLNTLEQGRQKLETLLGDYKSALHIIHLGLQFGIKVDLEAIEREIERQVALHGGATYDTAIARLALAFTKKSPEKIANYIEQHYDELAKYFDKKSLKILQIEMLSQAEMPEMTKECLNDLIKEGISKAEENRLSRIISQMEGMNPIEAKKEQFRETGSLGDLIILVEELEIKGEWVGLCEFGEILFERTRSLQDAERLAKALSNMHNNERLVEFFKTNYTLIIQSKNLQMLYCWALYYEGYLLEARSELSKLGSEQDNPNYRALQINIGITLGDWNSLTVLITNECLNKHRRGAEELIGIAQLAFQLGSPHAKELIFAVADKGKEDAGILVAAYTLASKAGLENNAEVYQWLNKAAELSSGKEGPIQKMSLKDVLNMKPNWEQKSAEVWQLLSHGDIPMFVAAESLNKTLIHMMLFPAMANQLENDPRRRGAVYAYSGNRQPSLLNTSGVIAIEATALLTLCFLNLLDVALNAFDTVYIPHSTLVWLFEEKHKAAFHQPSRFRVAHQIQHLLSTGVIEKLKPNAVPDSELSAQIGNEMAVLIAEAEKMSYDDNRQRVVVRSSPVHRLASFMEEEADLTTHAEVLSSCQAIVNKLRQKGQITADEVKKAQSYFQLYEKSWPNQPEISDEAILYLDSLTITYFLDIGILEKLKAAGFSLIVSPKEVSEANEFISYEGISGRLDEAIEHIRSVLYLGIKSGKIKVGKKHNFNESGKQVNLMSYNTTMGLFSLSKDCDVMLVDDRFINQHSYIDDRNGKAKIFSTIELIDALVSNGCITNEQRFEYRTMLRRGGYCFIPIGTEELEYHLKASTIDSENIIETAELKAIRENILHVRMRNWLQIPKESLWLDTLLSTFVQVLHGLWRNETSFSSIRACSNWIINQVNIRGWAQNFGQEYQDNIVKTKIRAYILLLLTLPADTPSENRKEYWSWIEDKVLTPIKEQNSDLYSWIVEWYRKELSNITDKGYFKEVRR